MGHIPHLLVEGPWATDFLDLSDEQRAHLDRVLRVGEDEALSYTDGQGRSGEGRYRGGGIVRGDEVAVPRPTDLIVAVAPPGNRDRLRFMVEKLSELGVAEIRFLATVHTTGRPPRPDRARSWAVSGLEQSRGGWLMRVGEEAITLSELGDDVLVCDPGGRTEATHARTVVIGPEGGWAPGEIPETMARWSLGSTVLRVETAAIVAASRLL